MCVWLLLAQLTQATSNRDGHVIPQLLYHQYRYFLMKYRTWFLATPIRYLAHVMYFGVPGTYGTSVPSERLFSKATARSNIKPKNVNMILTLNKNILCFGIVQ